MTYEAEMIEYLQAKQLPTDEGTYPEELMTQITINAFEELFERIEELDSLLETSDEENKILQRENEVLKDLFIDIQNIVNAYNKGEWLWTFYHGYNTATEPKHQSTLAQKTTA